MTPSATGARRRLLRTVLATTAAAVALVLSAPLSGLAATVPAATQPTGYPSDSLPYPNYSIDLLDGFDDVLKNHPETVKANSDLALAINHAASDAQTTRAQSDARTASEVTVSGGLGAQLGGTFLQALDAGELPLTRQALSLAGGSVAPTDGPKAHWNYKRPFEVFGFGGDGVVKRDTADSYNGLRGQGSYPSGHTTGAYRAATVLATLLPQLAPQILARASEAGDNRIVLGVHYPLDVMGGRMLAQAAVSLRWSDPAFRSLLLGAKDEIQRVLASRCGDALASCIEQDTPYLPTQTALSTYDERMHYGFASTGATDLPASVPAGAENLLITAFPDLTSAQRRQVLAATSRQSGDPLDKEDGSGSWERLDLAAAFTAKVSVGDDGALVVNGARVTDAAHPTVDALQQDDALQQRWLSTPGSRAVINPLDYNQGKTEAATNGGPNLPLGAAYYAADTQNVANNVLGIYEAKAGTGASVYHDAFDSLDPAWKTTDVTAAAASSAVTVALPGSAPKNWGNMTRSVTIDLSRTPKVTISVPATTGKWSLKVNDGTQANDISLTPDDMSTTGSYTYDVSALTGWKGVKTMQLRLFVVGKGTSTTVDDIAFPLQSIADGSSFVDTFDSLDPAWTTRRGATAAIASGALVVGMPSGASTAWGGVTRQMTVDLDKNPIIRLQASGGTGLWSLKLNGGGSDIELQHDTASTGDAVFDVAAKTGWSGVKTFSILLNVIGGGTSSSFDSVSFEQRNSTLSPATSFTTSWRADSLPFQADYASAPPSPDATSSTTRTPSPGW